MAPATGIYSIQVTSASGYVDYGWKTGSCAETGWTCIDDISSAGAYGSLSWNAGTTYYLLLDDEDNASGTHQFYINCVASPPCSLSLGSSSANVSSSSGSTTFSVNADAAWTISESCSWLSVSPLSGSGNATITINYDANTSGSRNCVLTVSCGSSTQYFTITQAGTAPANPCDGAISIANCGSAYSKTYTGGGTGIWNTSYCLYSTPGLEQVYSFVAPATGIYSLQVTSASGYVDYGWKAGSCAETGWTCIDDINSAGTFGSLSWNAGTTYYLLLDDEDNSSGTHQFYINCVTPPPCSLSLSSSSANVSSSSGSTTFSVTANAAWTISESCSWLSVSPSSGSGNATITINYDANTSVSRNCVLTVSCGTSTQYFTITQAGAAPTDPCSTIISIAGYGSAYQQTYTGGGAGVWNTSFCAFSTPGLEQVYSFVAPVAGIYNIEVTSASGYVDYGWKSGSCAETGWTCIDDINSTGTFGPLSWNAGTTYYLLLDDEDNSSGTHQFYINCIPTGITNNSSFAGQLVFYPNPLTDQLYIELPESNLNISEVEIFNTLGEVIFSGLMKNKLQIDFSKSESGIYYLKVKTQNISEIKKLIKL